MSDRLRLRIFLVAAAVFFACYGWAALGLPAFGTFHAEYGRYIAQASVLQRHTTDVVNAINYDYRAFDTLGEEFILFTSTLGVLLLLRRDGTPKGTAGQVQDAAPMSPSSRAAALGCAALTIIFGFYIGLHGQLTPCGGFQGGVILATAPLLIYLAENKQAFQRVASHHVIEVVEAAAAGGYALIGLAALLLGAPLLTNFLPLGKTGNVFSSGTIGVISVVVGFEVTAAFLLVVHTYLQEIIAGGTAEE